MRRWLLPVTLVACVLLDAWVFVRRTAVPTSVVVITIDTIRADRLSAYGFGSASQPALDRLAREGVVFEQAISVAPLTLPAHTSLFTGLFPPGHEVRDNVSPPAHAGLVTLAELLREQGYRTGAFTGSTVLAADRGLAQGFERYTDSERSARRSDWQRGLQRRADAVVADAIDWLDADAGSRFFLWTHFYDPHRPYDPPEPYRSEYVDPYLGEIAFVDSQVARLLEALDRRGRLASTFVVVAGDHGESLGDHGERDHGIFVYDAVLRVPLIIAGPGLAPARVATTVRLVDVMPTVLDLVGRPIPAMDGISLVDLMRGRPRGPGRDVYAESFYPRRLGWAPLRTLRDDRFKLIDAPRPELYDLSRDPFEQRNVLAQHPMVAAALRARLNAVGVSPAASRSTAGFDPQVQERLSSLGYVGTTAGDDESGLEHLPDPKDCISLLQRPPVRDLGAQDSRQPLPGCKTSSSGAR